jgi:adhesin transport system outer membrane protein
LVEWRRQLAEAAAAGRAGAAEQVALQAVALSLDRSRYGLQAQVYGQYVRKMACLVDQLKAITALDQGRASELTQAQKNQQQAELALATTQDFLKSTETRLRRLVGDPLPPPAALAAVLARLPELAALQKDLIEAQDVAQASAQALAARRLAEAVAAGQKPQLSYLGSVNGRAGNGRQADWIGGVQLSIPLFNAQDEPQRAAALKRAAAADAQRDETLEAKTWRLQEVHDAAGNALDRARRITELLRASQQLRSATLLQWQQLGRRSLFDVMSAEADYYALRVAHVNALYDAQQAVALMGSMGARRADYAALMSDTRLTIYTVLTGAKEALGDPLAELDAGAPPSDLDIDWVCFTDDPDLRSSVWQIRWLDEPLPPERLSRRPKMLPHEYLPDAHMVSLRRQHRALSVACRRAPTSA